MAGSVVFDDTDRFPQAIAEMAGQLKDGRMKSKEDVVEGGSPPPPAQPRNPLHGLTLEAIVSALAAHYGWAGLAEQVPVRCFAVDPSVASSLKFLRKTPWAREKVESLYLFMLREQRRGSR